MEDQAIERLIAAEIESTASRTRAHPQRKLRFTRRAQGAR